MRGRSAKLTGGENDYPSVTCGDSSPDKGSLLGAPQKRKKIYKSNLSDNIDTNRQVLLGDT